MNHEAATGAEAPPTLTITRLFAAPDLAGAVPRHARFSPDGRLLAWLAPGDAWQRLDLWLHDTADASTRRLLDAGTFTDSLPLTAAERDHRERTRTTATGFVEFAWSRAGDALLVPHGGALYEVLVGGGPPRRLTPEGTRQAGFQQSPDGAAVAWVRDGQLFLLDRRSGVERPLTPAATPEVTYGLPDFIAQEELHLFRGFWFSPDGRCIALLRVDTSPIPTSHRHEVDTTGVRVIGQRYPYAGGPNARVDLLLCDLDTGRLREVAWRNADDDYLARVTFARDGTLLLQRQPRDQRRLDLVRCDADTSRVLLHEHAATWVNVHDNLQPLADGGFLWTSERDGPARLYAGDRHGALRVLTDRDCHVSRVLATPADPEHAWWLGWRHDPGQCHLFRTRLSDAATTRLSGDGGWHDCEPAADGSRIALLRSDAAAPPQLLLGDGGGTGARPLANALAGAHPYLPLRDSHPRLERGSLPAEDGQALWWRLWLPAGGRPADAVLVNVYGGPGVQRARDEWPSPWHLFLARQGIAVFELDNRGSGNRGRAFEAPIHGRLGDVEVRDQLRGVDYLVGERGFAAGRIAVQGHSYGGYMALLLLARAPGRFRCGISVAPVCDWRLYDTHYTERYLGMPDANADGYAASGVEPWLDGLASPLLLVHGMADDNVLFTHSVRIIDTLQRRNRQFRLMAYPGSRHGLSERHVAVHRHEMMYAFLREHLPAPA
jgi:dipeptidyl-peptidase-4